MRPIRVPSVPAHHPATARFDGAGPIHFANPGTVEGMDTMARLGSGLLSSKLVPPPLDHHREREQRQQPPRQRRSITVS
jgi:hypothetical protein